MLLRPVACLALLPPVRRSFCASAFRCSGVGSSGADGVHGRHLDEEWDVRDASAGVSTTLPSVPTPRAPPLSPSSGMEVRRRDASASWRIGDFGTRADLSRVAGALSEAAPPASASASASPLSSSAAAASASSWGRGSATVVGDAIATATARASTHSAVSRPSSTGWGIGDFGSRATVAAADARSHVDSWRGEQAGADDDDDDVGLMSRRCVYRPMPSADEL
jgi:hypothetical protein